MSDFENLTNELVRTHGLQEAVYNLYAVFSTYQLGPDFTGCECCVSCEEITALRNTNLEALAFEDLQRYSQKAMTTWGEVCHFKYFFPRLMELSISHHSEFQSVEVLYGKLVYAHWERWPDHEKEAVRKFLQELWNSVLLTRPDASYSDTSDNFLCAIGATSISLAPFLQQWQNHRSKSARLHFIAFINQNFSWLVERGQLVNPYWDQESQPYQEVVEWLANPELEHFLPADEELEDIYEPGRFQWQLVSAMLRSS